MSTSRCRKVVFFLFCTKTKTVNGLTAGQTAFSALYIFAIQSTQKLFLTVHKSLCIDNGQRGLQKHRQHGFGCFNHTPEQCTLMTTNVLLQAEPEKNQ